MKHLLLLLLLSCPALAGEDGILPNPSFETSMEGRPKGWRVFLVPETVTGEFYISSGEEGVKTHTGSSALQFHFPENMEVAQATWMADPKFGGGAVDPGEYTCAFWIRGGELPPEAHVWVSVVGYDEAGKRTGELGRSEYLTRKILQDDAWTQIRFRFPVSTDSGTTRVAPVVVFKSNPAGTPVPASEAMRVMLDDLQIAH